MIDLAGESDYGSSEVTPKFFAQTNAESTSEIPAMHFSSTHTS